MFFGKNKTKSALSESGASESEVTSYAKGSESGSGFKSSSRGDDEQGSAVEKKSVTISARLPPKSPMASRKTSEDSQADTKGLQTIDGASPSGSSRPRLNSKELAKLGASVPRRGPRAPSAIGSTFTAYQSTAVASSTFNPAAHERALRLAQANTGTVGAGAVDDSMPLYYEDDDEASTTIQENLYDVFAPSGPIGVVVDTTRAGPIVHSLKKTSPMQGLMGPGDLIVALDGQDVRSMNAQQLTKLMAQKSKQSERKFTLMPVEDFR